MTPKKTQKELEARIEYLEEINRFSIDALEMAASLGDFQVSINKLQEPSAILKETDSRVKRLIPFQAVAFYLVDEATSNFFLAHLEPEDQRDLLQGDVDFLIDNGTFAWALREHRGVSVSSKDFHRHMLLHVMATYSRIRGLFVGLVRPGEKNIPEVSLSVLSIILLNSANALESFELYRMVQKGRDELEIRVKERTLELAETNEKLQQEVIERKQSEEALRKSEEKYRRLVENAPLGILTIDTGGQIADFNPILPKILGSPSPEAIRQMNVFDFSPLLESGIANDFLRCLASGMTGTFENDYKTSWGKEVNLRYHLTPIWEDGNQIAGVQALLEDISERCKLENQLHQAQKMEAIGMLAGGVAHDLNNILAGLVSYPDLLLLDLPDESPMRAIVTTIKNSGQRAAAIVQDLLTLARRGVAVQEVIDVNQIVGDYFKTPEYEKLKANHPPIHIQIDLEETPLKVLCSPVHLFKVVMNLVSNAAEAMPQGGTIRVATSNRYIEKALRGYEEIREGEYIVLTVEDEGTGISPNDIHRIFEPFYTKKIMGRSGTGLGLAVVWGAVKDHKGFIDLHSTEGKGTKFEMYFPVTRQEINPKDVLITPEALRGTERILVVDDVQEQREIASMMLTKLGYQVHVLRSGEEAVEYLKRNAVDLVILDMIMDPGMDGLQTYLKILEIHPRQKAIIMSGYSETHRVKEAQRLGAGTYLKKPFVMEKIGLAVRRELDKGHPRVVPLPPEAPPETMPFAKAS